MACDPFMLYKTAAEIQSGAMASLKGIDPKKLAAMAQGKDPKALLASMPASLQGLASKVRDICFFS
jgi:hypothetical protein